MPPSWLSWQSMRRQIVQDVPLWSEFVRQEAGRSGYPYIDTRGDFAARLRETEAELITAGTVDGEADTAP